MFKRKQWISAVRRGRKYVLHDKNAAPPIKSVVKDKEKLEEKPTEKRREDETNEKKLILKKTGKRKKGNCCSDNIQRFDANNEKEKHHVHSYNPPIAVLTTSTSSCIPRPSIVPSNCYYYVNKDTSKYDDDEHSGSLSSSHSSIHSFSSSPNDKGKKGMHINNNKIGKNLTHQVIKKRGRAGIKNEFSKRTKRRIYFTTAVGIKLLIVLLTIPFTVLI